MLNLQIWSICIFALELFLYVLVLLKESVLTALICFSLLEAEESKKLKTRRSDFCDESLFFSISIFNYHLCLCVWATLPGHSSEIKIEPLKIFLPFFFFLQQKLSSTGLIPWIWRASWRRMRSWSETPPAPTVKRSSSLASLWPTETGVNLSRIFLFIFWDNNS